MPWGLTRLQHSGLESFRHFLLLPSPHSTPSRAGPAQSGASQPLSIKAFFYGRTSKALLVSVPSGVTTAIGPLAAPLGTTAVNCVFDTAVKLALTPLKVTPLVCF